MLPAYLVLYVLAALQIVHVYDMLPARLATHFSAAGVPDRWMAQDSFIRFHFVFVIAVSASFWAIGALVAAVPPRQLSIPHRDYWTAPPRLKETRARLRNLVALMGIVAGLGAMYVDGVIIDVNTSGSYAAGDADFRPAIIGMALGVVLLTIHAMRSFRLPSGSVPEKPAGKTPEV